jgi:hypothetical protein
VAEEVKKAKSKKRTYVLLVVWFIVSVIFIAMLLYKPAGSEPFVTTVDGNNVSPYLTHVLSPQLYNGAQRQEPFELHVSQRGINEIVSRRKWPMESEGVRFLTPVVYFVPSRIVVMGTALVGGVEVVMTVIVKPVFTEEGLLELKTEVVKVGAVNITLLARIIAEKMYKDRLGELEFNVETLGTKIAGALLAGEPFEPVFEVPQCDGQVRARKITIAHEELTIRFVPASP